MLILYMVHFGCHGNVNFERTIYIYIFLFEALLGQIWVILNLYKLSSVTFSKGILIAKE